MKFFEDQLRADVDRPEGGCIVNISCIFGHRPEPDAISYSMAKAGLEMLTKSAAMELSAGKIRVNAVAPSFIQNTNLFRYMGLSEESYKMLADRTASKTPLQRNVRDEEVAKAVIFLTSEQ